MDTTASFKDIRKNIKTCIYNSKQVIKVAVAWMTSKELLGLLNDKLDSGCVVELIISDHIENRRLSFETFISKGGKIYILPTKSGRFLHDKFAIFDDSKILAGSYNWTNSAEFYNHEFIIKSVDPNLLTQFKIRFEFLKDLTINFNQLLLQSRDDLYAETKEDEFLQLEKDLEETFINTIKEANQLGAGLTSYVINFIHRFGGIGAANQLIGLGEDKLHSGLKKLWEIKRLDLSFESIILQDKFKMLFTTEILAKAQARLKMLS
jgi:hypothetical protein